MDITAVGGELVGVQQRAVVLAFQFLSAAVWARFL